MHMRQFLLAGIFLASCGLTIVAEAAYDIKVSITFPKGSAGQKNVSKYPSSTPISPCNTTDFDALTLSVTYDASNTSSGVVDRDVYILMHNPEARGAPRFMVFRKQGLGSSLLLLPRAGVDSLSPTTDIYQYRTENLSSSGPVTETLISSSISAQSAANGLWQLVGIVADGTSPRFSFDDPSTWDAWDAATIMLKKPWMGYGKPYCE